MAQDAGRQNLLDADDLAQGFGQLFALALPQSGDLEVHQQVLSALRAMPAQRQQVAPGKLLDDRLTIACGAGALRLVTVQRPGKAPLEAAAFLRGFKLAPGTVLA